MANNLSNPAAFTFSEADIAQSPGILISDYYKQGFGYHVVRNNGTPNWLIFYTLNGKGQFRIRNHFHTCESRDIVILPSGIPHDYRTVEGEVWEFHWALFVPLHHWFSQIRMPEVKNGIYSIRIQDNIRHQRIDQAFESLQQDQFGESVYQEFLGLNSIELIFILIAQEYEKNCRNQLDHRIETVLNFLTENLQKSIQIKELAHLVSLSPSRLSHLFKKETGSSIIDTLLMIRLRHASNLLRSTSLSIGEVADHVGFSSIYYFSQQFSNYFGISPSDYRKKVLARKL